MNSLFPISSPSVIYRELAACAPILEKFGMALSPAETAALAEQQSAALAEQRAHRLERRRCKAVSTDILRLSLYSPRRLAGYAGAASLPVLCAEK